MTTHAKEEDRPEVADPDATRAEWLGRLNALATQIKGYAEADGWRTRTVMIRTRDSILGRFEVPLLLMEREAIQIALNPVSRFVGDSEGLVELYVVPGYEVLASLRLGQGGRWALDYAPAEDRRAPAHEPAPLDLTEVTLNSVLDLMVAEHERQI